MSSDGDKAVVADAIDGLTLAVLPQLVRGCDGIVLANFIQTVAPDVAQTLLNNSPSI